jgi:hypothetical protein
MNNLNAILRQRAMIADFEEDEESIEDLINFLRSEARRLEDEEEINLDI